MGRTHVRGAGRNRIDRHARLLNGCAQAHHLGEQAQRLWSVNERDTFNELRGGVEDIEQTAWGRGRLS